VAEALGSRRLAIREATCIGKEPLRAPLLDPSPGPSTASALRWLHLALWAVLCAVVFREAVLPAWRPRVFGFLPAEGRIVDYAAHRNFVRQVWLHASHGTAPRESSAYSVAHHVRVTEAWTGVRTGRALPFGYAPTMIWLLTPFALMEPRTSFLLWTALGLLAVYWMTRPRFSPFGAGLIVFFSALAVGCFLIGQTAVLATAGVLYLAVAGRTAAGRERTRWLLSGREWALALVLWMLTAKPPLAVVAGVALGAMGRWRVIGAALAMTAISTAALQPWLGRNWIGDYLDMALRYNRADADPAFAWSFVPGHMANLRALLHVDLGLGDGPASRLSLALWTAACVGLAGLARRGPLPAEACWSLSILAYLTLFPHVTSTEELLLYVPAVLACWPRASLGPARWMLVLLVWALPFLSPAVGPAAGQRLWLLGGKVALVPLCLLAARREPLLHPE